MSDYIPEEIQLQILHLLPVKSLLRFRCVCKSWREIIDSHSFPQSHLALHKPGFLLRYKSPEFLVLNHLGLPDTSQDPLQSADDFLIGTHHGIVCLGKGSDADDDIRIWNPSIRRVISIPGPRDHWFGDQLATTYTSFWIDPSTKHFKIFILNFGDWEEGEYNLYSSARQEWTGFQLPELLAHRSDGECEALLVGEVAYWTSEFPYNEHKMAEYKDDAYVVYSFDFVRESFDIIETPLASTEVTYCPVMCNWHDSLSLLYSDDENRCNLYSRQGGSWVNVLRVSLPSDMYVFWVQEDRRVLAMAGDELVMCDDGGDRDTLVSFEKKPYINNPFNVFYGYVESLLFP